MEKLDLSIYNRKVDLKPEISEYFVAANYFATAKINVEKILRKYQGGDLKFFEETLKNKILESAKEVRKYIEDKIFEKKMEEINLSDYFSNLENGINELYARLYDELLEKVKTFTNEVNYVKIDEFKKSLDVNVNLIFNLSDEYGYKNELKQYWTSTVYPKFIIGINNRIAEYYNGILELFLEKLDVSFDEEKSKTYLKGLLKDLSELKDLVKEKEAENIKKGIEKKNEIRELKKGKTISENGKTNAVSVEEKSKIEAEQAKAENIVKAIEAYPLSIVEDTSVLFSLLQDEDIHDDIIKVIKFVHAENSCFANIEEQIKNNYYKVNIDEHRENYKNVFYKCLRYREELTKISALETMEECYKDIYNDLIEKINTVEELILNEKRLEYLCSTLSLDKEVITLKILERIENANIAQFYDQKKSIESFDYKKISLIGTIYAIILLAIILFFDLSIWEKVIFGYIYLFFGFVAFVWYAGIVRDNKKKYDGIFENFKTAHEKREQYAEKVIRLERNPNKADKLRYTYQQLNNEVAKIMQDYEQSSNNKLLNIQRMQIDVNGKKINITPFIIIALFLIWIILIACNIMTK